MRKFSIAFAIISITLFAPMAESAGFRIVEQDNAGQGMAHAMVANVHDAASVYYNPAAMTQIDRYAVKGGIQLLDTSTDYTGSAGASASTSDDTFVIPHLYMVRNVQDWGVAVGFGVFTNFGLATTWPDTGPFKYVATKTELTAITYNLNVAKKLSDNFSIAVGADYMTSDVTFNSMYPFPLIIPGSADGKTNLTGDGDGWGFNLAALIKVSDQIKIGITYRSEISTDISGDLEVTNFPAPLVPLLGANGISGNTFKTGTSTNITYPAIFVVGASYQPTEALTLEVDVDYTGWSSYDTLEFKNDRPLIAPTGTPLVPSSSEVKNNWDDVVAFRFGAEFQYSEVLVIRGGYYFDPNPVPDDTLSPRLADLDRHLFTTGLGYSFRNGFTLDAALSYIYADTRSVTNSVGASTGTTVSGDYESTIYILGLSGNYNF